MLQTLARIFQVTKPSTEFGSISVVFQRPSEESELNWLGIRI